MTVCNWVLHAGCILVLLIMNLQTVMCVLSKTGMYVHMRMDVELLQTSQERLG